jgi:hypothetical protein
MTCRALFFPSPRLGTVLMPVIIDDAFYDDLGASLPGGSLSLLLPAASWSARHSKSGWVPSWVIAKHSSDPDADTGQLFAAGAARRGKNGGMHIVPGKGITIINADDAAQQEERTREQGRIRAQRKRDRDKAARAAAVATGVTPGVTPVTAPSRSPVRRVTPTKAQGQEKPQVSDEFVTRYEVDSSRVTAETDGPAHQDNQDLSIGSGSIGVDPVNARAREDPDPAVVTYVTGLITKKAGRPVSAVETRRAMAVWDKRAEDAGKVIHDPRKFYTTCVRKERDIEALLAPPANPLWEKFGAAPEPVAGAHAYAADQRTGVCGHEKPDGEPCGLPRPHAKHLNLGEMTG